LIVIIVIADEVIWLFQLCGDCHKWHSLSSGSDWWSYEACRCAWTTGLDSVNKWVSVLIN